MHVRDSVPQLAGTGVQPNLLDPGWLRTDQSGPRAPNDPSPVIPAALVPALPDDGESGLAQALEKPSSNSVALVPLDSPDFQ